MEIEIPHRYTGDTLFAHDVEGNTIRITVAAAIKAGVNLRDANLEGADLRSANLIGANLEGADLEGAKIFGETLKQNPIIITGLYRWVMITDKHMKIGGQEHSHEEWEHFTDEEISKMSERALTFWTNWKAPLMTMCNAHSRHK